MDCCDAVLVSVRPITTQSATPVMAIAITETRVFTWSHPFGGPESELSVRFFMIIVSVAI